MRIQVLVAVAICGALPCNSPGGEPSAKIVAPYLDDQTVAVAHLDLAGIDVDAAVERIATATGIDAKMLADPRRSVREGLAMFRKAGATDLYVVLSLADLPNPGPFVLAPRAGANDDELKAALRVVGGWQTIEPLDGVMFAGSKSARERLRTLKPAPRPDLEAAWQSVAGSPLQIAFVPGVDHRRVFTEMIPTLPKEVGGGPGTILTKGIRWAAVGIDWKPKIAVKLVVQSENAAAAKALAQAIDHGLETASHDQGARHMFPRLDEMVAAVRPKIADARLTIAVDDSAPGMAAAGAGLVAQARSNAGRTMSMNNLKQLALAWHISLDARQATFPDNIKSKDGKPLLSWRVAILPYIEQDALYKQFHLDEPWDSEHNKTLIAKMPALFRSPAQKVGDGKTTYLAPTGMVDKAHVGMLGTRIRDITDGTSNTFMIVEANDDAAVEWTKPVDFAVDVKNPLKGLIGHYEQGFNAAFGDGSVRLIQRTIKPMNLLAAFTRDGGEVPDFK